MIDLDAELNAALARRHPDQIDALTVRGVADFLTRSALRLVGTARVRFEGRYYQPDEHGEPAVIVAVRADGGYGSEFEHAAPRAVALAGKDVVDLIAFVPTAPARFALRAGKTTLLGLMSPQLVQPDQVMFHRTPLHWLLADGNGVVILDHRPQVIAGILAMARKVVVADTEHGRELRAIAQRPQPGPSIFVALGQEAVA